jgi:hypothetical protein
VPTIWRGSQPGLAVPGVPPVRVAPAHHDLGPVAGVPVEYDQRAPGADVGLSTTHVDTPTELGSVRTRRCSRPGGECAPTHRSVAAPGHAVQ